ncbi:hypothetical protein [Pseudomonas sp. CYM-20-01]|uniref:hypothetical protein n=1 Tax=Pseudomonas sp. CYM-20-01 TaxID=2870750 RepID=UPI0020BD84E4|nr:hypothetical protein [Pseudomonas sp. CYM-20-01]
MSVRKNLIGLTLEVKIMKSFLALPYLVLMLMSAQASALCLTLTDSYSGIIQPDSRAVALGPFTISGANGCSNANIDAMVSAAGGGRPPQIYIEQQVGGAWKTVAGNPLSAYASWLGSLGTYRVILDNPEAVSKSYWGTVRFGR